MLEAPKQTVEDELACWSEYRDLMNASIEASYASESAYWDRVFSLLEYPERSADTDAEAYGRKIMEGVK